MLPPVILASASPRRSSLLRDLLPSFTVIPSDAPESAPAFLSPREICQLNACRKARVIAMQNPESLVIGADTLVFLGRRNFSKPRDLSEARRMLARLAGHTHQVITAVCLVVIKPFRQQLVADHTSVTFRHLTSRQIDDYLSLINPLDKAGAYALQEHSDLIVSRIAGSYSNVVGLPLEVLNEALDEFSKPPALSSRPESRSRYAIRNPRNT